MCSGKKHFTILCLCGAKRRTIGKTFPIVTKGRFNFEINFLDCLVPAERMGRPLPYLCILPFNDS